MARYNRGEPNFINAYGGAGYPIRTASFNGDIITIGHYMINLKSDWGDYISLNKSPALWDIFLEPNGSDAIFCWIGGNWGKCKYDETMKKITINLGTALDPKVRLIGYVVSKTGKMTSIVIKKEVRTLKIFTHDPHSPKINCDVKDYFHMRGRGKK